MIQYFFEEIEPIIIGDETSIWLENLIISEDKSLGKIQYIFCDDEYLLKINKDYLQHDYFTDIITFDYVKGKKISGDIFVSLQRISDNAAEFCTDKDIELKRVLAHGLLHLCGYKDKTDAEQHLMTEKENFYLDKIL
ncbi:rRNA maturation RNase YbeY [Frigoriflavimonas asaccharolytica]|uniref:Endoribonuclease YbeY n=1 Tax=Frigoriflavimonas asaccharolytica TaxID=2735899 RepID=A0A8J8KA73_9FLAO|nr:rRNA maturation RNase YbeY [Frigoriflavimonas asaccharolytica]NRS91174.1 rRNA maturation RNase YbeY [Frigoriflavimonas asaccharolytica]